MKLYSMKKQGLGIYLVSAWVFSITGIALGQSNYVLKTGDTMTGTLSIEAPTDYSPAIELYGPSTVGKYMQFEDTTTGKNMVMNFNGSNFEWWFSPDGITWSQPSFSIGANGVLYGNAAGLTNINVALAIPDGSITVDKVSSDIVTYESFINDSIDSLEVGLKMGPFKSTTTNGSLTVGFRNLATNKSVAVGSTSQASGLNSFAAGSFTKTSGDYAQAFGENTEASGKWSHAEGWYNKAIGNLAHVEGWNNVVSGQYSHVEGAYNEASGWGSHVEGIYSKSDGHFSHVAGYKAQGLHDNVFIWSSSNASNDLEFASTTNKQFSVYADNGIRLITGENGTVEIDSQIIGDGSGLTNLMFTSNMYEIFGNDSIDSLEVGGVGSGPMQKNTTGTGSLTVGRKNQATDYSFASGWGAMATGAHSHAEGYFSKAMGEGSHAEGGSTEASGKYAHAEGYYSKATGFPSHAEGWSTLAEGGYSHAEGAFTKALELGTHAQGYESEARGKISHAAGWSAIADHDQTFVWSSNNSSNNMDFASTTNKQFSVYADNGIRLVTGSNAVVEVEGSLNVAGSITGNGSGLTEVNADTLGGKDFSNIGVYGDIGMGSFTNSTVSN